MRQSRYIWLGVIALICLAGIITWRTPKVVMTSLMNPAYNDSPQTAVQHFWGYLDSRQLDLAEGLLIEPIVPTVQQELATWRNMMANDPFISLQKVEFLGPASAGTIRTRVSWTAQTGRILTVTIDFELAKTAQGWKIKKFSKV